jgi:hypothetical protein
MITMTSTYRNTCRNIFFSVGLMLALSFPMGVLAQFTTARVNGKVADISGAALAEATVKVEQVATRFTRVTASDKSGEFLFPALPVGQYQITVRLKGFNTYTQRGITLATNQNVTLPIELKVGSVDQNLTVTATATLVTTDSATLGQLIVQEDIFGLPLNNRFVQQLVFIVPGA